MWYLSNRALFWILEAPNANNLCICKSWTTLYGKDSQSAARNQKDIDFLNVP